MSDHKQPNNSASMLHMPAKSSTPTCYRDKSRQALPVCYRETKVSVPTCYHKGNSNNPSIIN